MSLQYELVVRLDKLYSFFESDAARGRVEVRLQVFSVCIAQLLNSPCLSSTAISRLNTGRVILDSRCWLEAPLWRHYDLSMEFDIVDCRRHREIRGCRRSSTLLSGGIMMTRRVDGVRHCWQVMETGKPPWTGADESSYSWSMEFDIVELWKTATMCLRDVRRWSSTRLDFVQLVDGVRHCWTLENGGGRVRRCGRLDYVKEIKLELLRTARTTLLDSTLRKDLNDVEQGVRQFGYYPRRDDWARWKFADRAESRHTV